MNEINQKLLEKYMDTHKMMMRCFHHHQRKYGQMSTQCSGQGRILKILNMKPEIMQKELADILGIRPQSLGETLAKLEKSECISRVQSESDRRNIIVSITEKGKQAISNENESENEIDIFSCLLDEEKEQLNQILMKLNSYLEQQDINNECQCKETGPNHKRQHLGHHHHKHKCHLKDAEPYDESSHLKHHHGNRCKSNCNNEHSNGCRHHRH